MINQEPKLEQELEPETKPKQKTLLLKSREN